MPEVIDLTVDSPPPKQSSDADEDLTRKKERRAERKEEKRQKKRDSGRRSRSRRREEERDPEHKEHHSHRHSDDKERDRDRDGDDRKRRRERESSRERDRERDSDRKRSRRGRERDRKPDKELFFIDSTPAELPAAARYTATTTTVEEPVGLILPAHVSVFGETPDAIVPAEPLDSDSDDDYIEYLDYDNRKDFVRYYEEQPAEKRAKVLCKKCGEDGHMAAECTVLICLTCGARDDHPTHRCNIAKTCFNCGMKGHINSDCPNPRADRSALDGCERCNSSSHQTSECPSLWRVYVYVEDAEHERILETRQARKGLELGQGGEGYIARDACCYNCGGSGHWGDDCQETYRSEPLVEPTAFSHHWLTQGPFTVEHVSERRAPRDWVSDIPLPGGVENVGRQSKRKEMEKLARRAKQQQQDADDDPADWFQSVGNGRKGERERERSNGNIPTGPRKSGGHPTFQFAGASPSKPSLVDRISDRPPDHYRDARSSNSRGRDSRDRASGSRHREREREKDRRDRGPRYRGGYS
ncbi:Protein air1 [Mycena sanguinolenta]|uniref:Protein air1 n=1 Tax=Mycena sanguinolenta TaxID=230812 RepID=A0A8H6YBF7_9AGAR|nr:Protein air1 [Mycena sanguinolenta]